MESLTAVNDFPVDWFDNSVCGPGTLSHEGQGAINLIKKKLLGKQVFVLISAG